MMMVDEAQDNSFALSMSFSFFLTAQG